MDVHDFNSLVLYYGRNRFYHSMQKAALDGLAKFPTQSAFRLFNGFALVLGNRVQEGIRELNPLKNEKQLALAAILALLFAHKRCTVLDSDAVVMLENRLKEERNCFDANGAYYAAVFLFFTGKMEKAREMTDKALKLDEHHDPSAVLRAWTELAQNRSLNANVLHTFQKVLAQKKNIDASLGEVRYFQLTSQFEAAINTLNRLSVRFPELNIPLIEKMETQLSAFNWDQSFETASRIINLESTNVCALRVKALLLVCRDSNLKLGVGALQNLLSATERVEMGNYDLLLRICQLFSRICSRNQDMLALTLRCVEKLTHLEAANVEFLTELGCQKLLLGRVKEAAACFRSVTEMDDNYFVALCGLTMCQLIEEGPSESTRQQIEYLEELSGIESDPLCLFLKAKSTRQTDQAVALIVKATDIHLRKLELQPFGVEYLRLLNPDFLLQLTSELLRHAPIQAHVKFSVTMAQDPQHITLNHCISILDALTRACPGHAQATYMRAKIEFLCGEKLTAVSTLQHILNNIDATYTDAYILLAQVYIQQQQHDKAMQTLEIALSYNFSIRDNPIYHLLLGIIQKQRMQYTDAQKSFLGALQLAGSYPVQDQSEDKMMVSAKSSIKLGAGDLAISDKATLYLELIDTFREMKDNHGQYEIERLLQIALDEFNNTPEEGRLVIAKAELMLQSYDICNAIKLLSSILPSQPYYIQAKTRLANVYLKYQRDRILFAKCFQDLVETCPETESYLMLGDAYMSIQEPSLAIDAYQKALSLNPSDYMLASKLGRAYVKVHQYANAINYYQEALKTKNHSGLKLDLAELLLKLKKYQSAIDILTADILQNEIDEIDVPTLKFRTKQYLLLARVYEKSGNITLSLQTLKDARENQYRVQKRLSVEQAGNTNEQQKLLSKTCLLMAQQSISLRENAEAIKYFKESLRYTPDDVEIMSSLARFYMQISSMDLCRDICSQILQIDKNNEVASVMMADLSFRKMEFDKAAYHFSQLLVSQPCYWTALARLIEVLRRSGTLTEANSFLQRAERATANPEQAAGLSYCKGLYEWYSGNPNVALRSFNTARKDYEWGQQAIFNMIEICMNPDNDIPSGNDIQELADSGDLSDSRVIALRTAERLLKELRPRPGGMDNETLNHRLLHNFLQLASKQKFRIESAFQEFTELAARDEYQNMVGPVLGVASALVMLKQAQRAKNQLKRIVRVAWNFEEAEYLERSWLLLADIYINANKLDVAETFVERVLEHNKSSTKAHELFGYIAEKSQLYRDAANHYCNAWNYGGRSKSHIGYKLAYNYMKIKRYADAIDICQNVLKMQPDYTIIKKDILEKCRSNLRN